MTLTQFDKDAAEVFKLVGSKEGLSKEERAKAKDKIMPHAKDAVRQLDALRTGSTTEAPIDLSWAAFIKDKWNFSSEEDFYRYIGINPGAATLQSFTNMADYNENYRWLVPEIIREAIRLGMDTEPIYKQLISAEESISQPGITMPFINRSDAMPGKLGEGQTIDTGAVSFGQKQVKTQKLGIGLKITDEVMQYVPINIMSIFFQDMGIKLNAGLDNWAIDTLINGDGNSNAAPVIGVGTVGTLEYRDLLRAWIRMGMITRQPQVILENENMAIETLMLPEFNQRDTMLPGIDNKLVNLRTPIPRVQDIWISGAMPVNNQLMMVDKTKAMIKLNAQPLKMENERIVERQISGTYATLTTGFAIMFTDGRLVIDKSLDFSAAGFPAYMDYSTYQRAQVIRP